MPVLTIINDYLTLLLIVITSEKLRPLVNQYIGSLPGKYKAVLRRLEGHKSFNLFQKKFPRKSDRDAHFRDKSLET